MLRSGAIHALILAVVLVLGRQAAAHAPTFAVYSKYEATTDGARVAFVFALDKGAVLRLLARDAAQADVEPADIARYAPFFSRYLFDRFTVSNDGVACGHRDELGRFFWDERTNRVLAVTSFDCGGELHELTIRSLVTHDMPVSHELFGDLLHGHALVRDVFSGDSVEARVVLPSLPQDGTASVPRTPREHGKLTYVTVPDTERRYEDLARAELRIGGPPQAPVPPPSAPILSFVGEGVRHIVTGFDHVLFIVTLMLVVRSWRHLAVIVTSFTAAHSVTLALATLGVVAVSPRIVEPLIAVTVLVVAVDAVVRPEAKARAAVAFGFGLVHGLGLSSVLRDLGLSGREVIPALFGFNVGVEIGQLAIVAPLFWLILLLRKRETAYARLRGVLCASVAAVALFWIAVRVHDAFSG
jgi:hydrogenase/urease accessory protein HupE